MANEQTSVPLFVADTILTAAQQNISAGTGVPVFATTVTRDAGFGGANKALAEGQLCYLSASNIVQYYDGAAWATVGPAAASGLTLVSATTIGTTVSSVTVSSAFSATYDAYKIVITGGISSQSGGVTLKLSLGATATGYYSAQMGAAYATATVSTVTDNNAASWTRTGHADENGINANIELTSPFLSKNTVLSCSAAYQDTTATAAVVSGFLNNTTSYTAFTITPSSGTLTGGTIRVYGYALS